ncbi:MAG TPA: hypothetical protein VIR32_00535 [Lachnospiraceae bacterium]
MKEIGGYYELERFDKEEYHRGLLALNLGRTALVYAMQKNKADKIYLPYFLCDSVKDICKEQGWDIDYYHIDKNFKPLGLRPLRQREYLYLVNYYGQISDREILALKETYPKLIVDHVHDFFRRPLEGIISLYSCRKFFGVSDGAYLSMDGVNEDKELEADYSAGRMLHVLGRLERDAGTYYQKMLENADTYHGEQAKKMSKLTQNLLRGIDYDKTKKIREDNYDLLDTYLKKENGKVFYRGQGPLAYPFYVKDGGRIKRELAKEKIYIPTYWSNVLKDEGVSDLEKDLAENILPLPCDQRYDAKDMVRLAKSLLACMEKIK